MAHHSRKYEIKEIMHKSHWGSGSHLKFDRTVEAIKDLESCWEKMQKYVRELYFICEIWAGRTKKPKKKIAHKHIDSYYSKERYQPNTVYLSDYLVSDKRYLLTMINHFNKYGWIVVLSDKSAATIIKTLKACIAIYGKPESLQTNNGSEFVNEGLKMYLRKNRIHYICGSPYYPQSQGAVKAFNKTVQNYLYLVKDTNEDEFIFEDSS